MMRILNRFMITAIVFVTVAVSRADAQDEAVEAAGEVGAEVEVVEVVEEVMEEQVMEDMAIQMPVDNKQLKLRRHAQVECALVRRVCKLTEEQQKKLAEIDDKWVDEIGKKAIQKRVLRQQQPGLLAMFFGAQPAPPQNLRAMPRLNVQQAVADHIDTVLTEEQKKLYEAEKQRRADFRNDAIADALIESLQERLGMTDEQRDAIKKRLLPWVAKQNIQTMHYFSGNNYYPEIPSHLLSKDLSKDQMAAYNSLQRYMFNDDNFNDGQVPIVIKQ